MEKQLDVVSILESIDLHTGTFEGTADWIIQNILNSNSAEPLIVSHINVYNYFRLEKSEVLKNEICKNCTLIFDGIGFKVAAYLSGFGFLPDLNGTDLFPLVMDRCRKNSVRIFLLGSEPNVIEQTVTNILNSYPGINIAGYHHGFFNEPEEKRIVEMIKNSRAQLLIIGRDFLQQEDFAIKYKDELSTSVIWNVGGLFDFISGLKPRAPIYIRKLRLEWLFRLLLEPKRMWYRNFIAAPVVIFKIIISSFKMKKIPKEVLGNSYKNSEIPKVEEEIY